MSAVAPDPGLTACGFHDAECAGFQADLSLWIALAETARGPILDVGAGTGRVSLALAAAGSEVTALDLDPARLDGLASRAADLGVSVRTVAGDARRLGELDVGRAPALVVVPMQTVQLLGGSDGRRGLFEGAARVAAPGAELVFSIVTEVEPFDGRDAFPALLGPDVATLGGFRFESTPLAVLQDAPGAPVHMHRRRVARDLAGQRVAAPEDVVITLDPLTADVLLAEGAAAGWTPGEVVAMAATSEHAASTIVTFRNPDGKPS